MLSLNQIEDIKLQAFNGSPSKLSGVCNVYPLLMGEILEMGYSKYGHFLGTLLLTPSEIREQIRKKIGKDADQIPEFDTLTYLLMSANQNDMFFLELQEMFTTFIKEDIILLPKISSVLVGSPEEKRLINSENFIDFQNILRIQNKKEFVKPPPENETPWERKKRLNAEKVAAAKKRQAEKSGGNDSLESMLEVAEVFGIDYKHKSLYAFYGLLPRYRMHEKWILDMQMICAGADSEKLKTKYWGDSSKED